MSRMVPIEIPVDEQAAKALQSPARREAVGRYVSWLLRSERAPILLAEAIVEAKGEARAAGLTDAEIDAELDAWKAERRA